MDSMWISLSLLLVIFLVPEASFGRSYKKTTHREDASNSMVFDFKEDSGNEKQFMDAILARINAEGYNSHISHPNTTMTSMKRLSRKRKSIFGTDNRINIGTTVQAQRHPYSTVVTLSSGCTGTLIGAQHVLTAAHCVHNGKRFIKQSRKLKIGTFY